MAKVFETIMLICFGFSWPISVCKSLRSKSTAGKSVFFVLAIAVGYVAGILSKILGDQVNYVLVLYCINLAIVSVDLFLCIYYRNRKPVNMVEDQQDEQSDKQ